MADAADAARAQQKQTLVQVALRLRPELDIDGGGGAAGAVSTDAADRVSYGKSHFRFAHVFGPSTSTADVFDAAHREHVAGVLKGYDCTLAAYGTTGSGKTHTMLGDEAAPGLVPLAVRHIFDHIQQADASTSFAVQLSALEILEERCVDLLHGRAPVVLRAANREGGLVFHGLRERAARSEAEVLALLHQAMEARTIGANYRHDASSRAHTVVRLRVESARLLRLNLATAAAATPPAAAPSASAAAEEEPLDALLQRCVASGLTTEVLAAKMTANVAAGKFSEAHYRKMWTARLAEAAAKTADADESEPSGAAAAEAAAGAASPPPPDEECTTLRDATSATLMLIDLAGSEGPTLNSSHAAVAQGVAVNKSLHWLRVAVHALTAGRPAQYRNSALTRLLQPSLGGHAVVAVLVTSSVRPPANTARDTLDALQFGEAVAKLKVAPKRRTEAAEGGQLEKLQALLIELNDDRTALASDSHELREQIADYSALIDEYRSGFVKREEAEEERARNAGLQAELAREVEERRTLEARLAAEMAAAAEVATESRRLEAEVAAAAAANEALKRRVDEEAAEVAAARGRVDGYEEELAKQREEADAQRARNTALRAELAREVGERTTLEARLAAEMAGAAEVAAESRRLEGEVAAAAAANAALAAEAKEVALAKDSLVLLKVKNKMYAKGGSRPGSRGSLRRLVSQQPVSTDEVPRVRSA